jgi:hypothetical protein
MNIVFFWKRKRAVEPVMVDIVSQDIIDSGAAVSLDW